MFSRHRFYGCFVLRQLFCMSTPAHYFVFCCTSSNVCLYIYRINVKGAVSKRDYGSTCSLNMDFIAVFFYGSCSVSIHQSFPWSFLAVIPDAGYAQVLTSVCRFTRLMSLSTHPPSTPSSYSEVLLIVLRYVYTILLLSPLLQSHQTLFTCKLSCLIVHL